MGNDFLRLSVGYLLLVEDEHLVQAGNKRVLERRGYSIKQAYTLAEARALVADEPPVAIVLDILLPDGNGLDFLQELRKTSNVPVLVLTAMGTHEDIIKGLEAGGDDYLTKPHELSVFLKRVEALLRRASLIPDALTLGPLKLDTASGTAYLNSVDMALAKKEYSLLQLLAQHPEKLLGKEYIYEKVWNQDWLDGDSALINTVHRLRKKLAGSGYTITSERNEGYCLEKE